MDLRPALPLLLLAFVACSRPAPEPAPPPAAAVAPPAVAEPPPPATIAADEPGIRVVVELSPAAAARLQAEAETVVIAATWFGEPQDRPEALAAAGDDAHWLVLASMQQELPGAGETIFPDMPLDPAKLALITTAPQFHVNVYSGRRASEHNLLSCDVFQDDLAKAASGLRIGCRLIGEADAP